MKPTTDYEFDQMVAEAKHKLGAEPVLGVLEAAAALFGWPIPPGRRDSVLLPLAKMVAAQRAARSGLRPAPE